MQNTTLLFSLLYQFVFVCIYLIYYLHVWFCLSSTVDFTRIHKLFVLFSQHCISLH